MNLKAYLTEWEERWKTEFEDVEKAFHEFKADQKALEQKKDDRINVLKGLEAKVAST